MPSTVDQTPATPPASVPDTSTLQSVSKNAVSPLTVASECGQAVGADQAPRP